MMMDTNMLSILLDGAAKGAAVLAVTLIATLFMRSSSAARRHLVWAAGVSALLLVPLLSFVMPAWGVLPTVSMGTQIPSESPPAAEVAQPHVPSNEPIRETLSTHVGVVMPSLPDDAAPRYTINATSVTLVVWAAGAVAVLLTITAGMLRVAVLARRTRPMRDSVCRDAVMALAKRECVDVDLLEGDAHTMPMTWGITRAKLLLPASAHDWSAARLSAVVRHELAHVKRRDALWQMIAEVACAAHWFNPLAWYAARRMRIEREHACDDAVLVAGSRPSEYATELLNIARSMRAARATSLAAIAMARPRQLEGRLLAVLDEKRDRTEVVHRWPLWTLAVCIVLPIAAMQPAVADVKAEVPIAEVPFADAPVPDVPSTEVPQIQASAIGALTAFDDQSPDCFRQDVKNLSINTNRNDSFTRVKWETRNCRGVLELTGDVKIAGDLSGFASIPAGGKVEIESKDNDHRRELTLTPAGNGAFTYTYKVDGDRRAWDNDGKVWLSSIITLLVRRGGFGADERVDHLFRTRGVQGVLDEVALMDSDYTQRLYLNRLLDKTRLNSGALRSVLALAERELDSDYELTELLIAVANRYDFNEESRGAFLQATSTLDSDYEHRRALSAVLKKGGLSTGDVAAVLASASRIDSDYEKAELLIGVAGKYGFDQRMRTAYLSAARNIDSSYEKRRVLTTLLKQGGLSASDLAYVIDASATVDSDYERSQILQMISANIDFSQPQLQESYLKAATDINSDHELRQVLSALLKRDRLSSPGIDVVLTAAGTINSDYERTEVLLQLMRTHTLSQAQRARVIKMADEMGSEHDRGRVSSVLLKQLNN